MKNLLIVLMVGGVALGEVRTASMVGEGMVLQREMAVPVWGQDEPGQTVTVRFRGHEASASAWKDGSWRLTIPSGEAGGPFEMEIEGSSRLTYKDVLVGEVWVASGQSNMAMAVKELPEGQELIASATDEKLRLFFAPYRGAAEPVEDFQAGWTPAVSEKITWMSAVAYYFARELREKLDVPVAIINSSWGGTNAETWTPLEAFGRYPELHPMHEQLMRMRTDMAGVVREYQRAIAEWEAATKRSDPGNAGFAQGWAKEDFDDSEWATGELPRKIEDLAGEMDGVVWFRRQVTLPAEWAGRDLLLELGPVDDFDITYWNGAEIGRTGTETFCSWEAARQYVVPGRLVKEGTNTIAIRVFDHFGNGGFMGPAWQMRVWLQGAEGTQPIGLYGEWKYKVAAALTPEHPELAKPASPAPPGRVNSPTALWNAMIYPAVPYGIRGAIWYQGEGNVGRAEHYKVLFPAMIEGWRRTWGQGEFPFLFVQLANYMARHDQPTDSGWARIREAQLETLKVPNTAMAVAIDIGDAVSIHPTNKKEVGRRLALAAEAVACGRDVVFSGPVFEAMEVRDGKAYLTFKHVDGGLAAQGEKLVGFAVAGPDRQFVWAEATIEGDRVVVWNDQIAEPAAVRYAWADNPEANLYNHAGLPASPFRTDRW